MTDTTATVTREQITDAARAYRLQTYDVPRRLELADALAALVFAYDEQQNDALIALHRATIARHRTQLERLGVEP